jgi:NodT family efflux transporter outer membrane factor (OMF) lipoprotein
MLCDSLWPDLLQFAQKETKNIKNEKLNENNVTRWEHVMIFVNRVMKIRRIKIVSLLITVFLITGCISVGPDYVRPDTQTSAVWHTPLKGGLVSGEADDKTLSSWWTTLNDPVLNSLVNRALANNLDLKKARASIREARAKRGVAAANLFPGFDATSSATRSRTGGDTGSVSTNTLYKAGFDASWELDIFGGVRRSVEAAQADLEASQEDVRDILVSLLGEVALNYIDVRTYQARLSAAEANLDAQRETVQITIWRSQAGLVDELDVEQARYSLESTRSGIPVLRTGLEGAMNRIAVLLGEQPGTIHKELEKSGPVPDIPTNVVVGIPADTIRRRPDIRKAERELAAQTARVGEATADLYPKFTLSGALVFEALSSQKLFSTNNETRNGSAAVTWPIFHGGSIRKNIEIQSALQEKAAINYDATLLSAFEEVENVLVAYAEEQNKRDALRGAEEAARNALELARYKYESGMIDFTSVLEAQRSLLSFQTQLAESNGAVVSNLVKLYKTLGGGWESAAVREELLAYGEKR